MRLPRRVDHCEFGLVDEEETAPDAAGGGKTAGDGNATWERPVAARESTTRLESIRMACTRNRV
jgi:hypothetical protein